MSPDKHDGDHGAHGAGPARALLLDAFGRIDEQFAALAEELADDDPDGDDPSTVSHAMVWRPDREANTIAWLLWHLARVQDDHIAGLAGTPQAWTENGWCAHFGLPFEDTDTGYGHTADQVAQVRSDPTLLRRYHADVHRMTAGYLESLTARELERVVDHAWDPPVTAGVRLVSVIGDCTAHLGQAQYVLGMYCRR